MIGSKKSPEFINKKIYDMIFNLEPKIRYVGFYYKGYFEGQIRKGKKSHLTEDESRRSLEIAINRWKDRKEFSEKIGAPIYTLTMYGSIKRITMELSNKFLILLSTEVEADHERLLANLMSHQGTILDELKISMKSISSIQNNEKLFSFEKQKFRELQQEKIIFKELFEYLTSHEEFSEKIFDAMSHELRTPTVIIKAYAEMLLNGEFGELTLQQKEKLKRIKENIDLLIDAIFSLLRNKDKRVKL